jgi:hypothetical protein
MRAHERTLALTAHACCDRGRSVLGDALQCQHVHGDGRRRTEQRRRQRLRVARLVSDGARRPQIHARRDRQLPVHDRVLAKEDQLAGALARASRMLRCCAKV